MQLNAINATKLFLWLDTFDKHCTSIWTFPLNTNLESTIKILWSFVHDNCILLDDFAKDFNGLSRATLFTAIAQNQFEPCV